ncbi:MAG TPA: hypothetical protein V6D13_17955 [Halomicronema sp.]
MNYSVADTALKIAQKEDLIEDHKHHILYHQAEIGRLTKEIKYLRCEAVINDEGQIISFSDIER